MTATTDPITYHVGDATDPPMRPAIIAHVVNDAGAWGAGFVVALSRRWPDAEADYRAWRRHGPGFRLGNSRMVAVTEDGLWVANMVAQHGIRRGPDGIPPIRYDALAEALGRAAGSAAHLGAELHMPRIGCGLAGGTWDRVEPIIREACVGVPVHVYDLPGAEVVR